jgi:lipoprotein-anchoring transpeptidase ErfK/SrfK
VMSHGCINLPMWFAEWLYYWAPGGMRIEISY